MYPPQDPNDPVRRAEYFHHRSNVKYSPKKLWYICCLVRGMTVDEAIKQLQFIHKKGAILMREVLEEAREIALKEHNFELKSNMFIGQVSFSLYSEMSF
jgi:large subunit ribosomal protein L22